MKTVETLGNTGLIFRSATTPGNNHKCVCIQEFGGGPRFWFSEIVNGQFRSLAPDQRRPGKTPTKGQWHKLRVRVQGDRFTTFLDDVNVVSTIGIAYREGAVGFTVSDSICRFRNIKVTAPNGQILWEGLPEIPTASSFGVLIKGKP